MRVTAQRTALMATVIPQSEGDSMYKYAMPPEGKRCQRKRSEQGYHPSDQYKLPLTFSLKLYNIAASHEGEIHSGKGLHLLT